MRIAVTGATGHLGSEVCRQLVALGTDDLIRIDVRPLVEGPGETRQADLSDGAAARAALQGAELVVHCAAVHPWKDYTDDEYLDRNIKGTSIPSEMITSIQKAPDKVQECIAIAAKITAELKEMGMAGVLISTVGWEDKLPQVLDEASLI